jgi:putative tryptophan/tyrosine transport system substrate-binding protein
VVMMTMGGPGAIVASFARPGDNITGVITFSTELTAKRVEILKELVPGLSRVALLHNMGNPAVPPEWEETKTAARSLGVQAELLDVRSEGDLSRAFELAVRQLVDGLVIGADGLTQMLRTHTAYYSPVMKPTSPSMRERTERTWMRARVMVTSPAPAIFRV